MGASQSTTANENQGLNAVTIDTQFGKPSSKLEMNPNKIRGLTRLFTEESKRKHDKDRDEHDIHRVGILLVWLYTRGLFEIKCKGGCIENRVVGGGGGVEIKEHPLRSSERVGRVGTLKTRRGLLKSYFQRAF